MTLKRLLRGIEVRRFSGSRAISVAGLAYDSRRARRRFLFFALPGTRTDGNLFVRDALARGAGAVVSENPAPASGTLPEGCVWIEVPDVMRAMGIISKRFHGDPARALTLVGITGTNGKTTTSYFLESILEAAGRPAGVIGTVNYRVNGRVIFPSTHTTPLAADLHGLLRRMRASGARAAVMEVSSHSLALKRVEEIRYHTGVFTNFSRDHLDFHRTRKSYLSAKLHLLDLVRRAAVLNRDDPKYAEFRRRAPRGVRRISYGLKAGADLRAADLRMSLEGSRFRMIFGSKSSPARISLPGEHNVLNALAAAGAALALGISMRNVVAGLQRLRGVPGRLEAIRAGQDFHVFVDYAHTDAALLEVLRQIKRLAGDGERALRGRLITVFGCGGDRDRSKRAPMGAIACRHSDVAVVTSDNPRSEPPARIIRDVLSGARHTGRRNYRVIADRAEAIAAAVRMARKGDAVLIAGKGHENYQILKGRTIHFDDKEIALRALQARRKGRTRKAPS